MNERCRELLEEGLRHHVLGDDEKAAVCFTRILEEDPSNEKAIRLLEMIRRPRTGNFTIYKPQDPPPLRARPSSPPVDAERGGPPSRRESPASPTGNGTNEADPAVAALMKSVEELHSLGDFSGSLQAAEKVLAIVPDHALAQDYLARNQKTLTHLYESKLGSVTAKPKVVLRPDEIIWLNIDHRAGFLLSQIDGQLTVEDLYALSGMSRMETAKILAELLADGVIEMG